MGGRWRVAIGAALVLLVGSMADAHGGADTGPTTVAELEAAFGIADIRSDYVVVIDTSQSMVQGPDPLYPKVQEAYSSLVDAIPDGDRLTLITFDSTTVKVPNIVVGSDTRDRARQLPPAEGVRTDIGAALASAVEALDQPDASDIQTVVFITDGLPEPRAGSPFDPVGSQAWLDAQARAAGLEARRTIAVRALGLTDAGKQGADLAAQVFGMPEVVRVDAAQLRDYLTTEVQNARRRLLEQAIQSEIDNGRIDAIVEADGGLDGEVRATVTLTSRLQHLGVEVDLEGVAAFDFEGDQVRSSIVDGSRTLTLAPRGSTTFEVLIKPVLEDTPVYAFPPPDREEVDITLDLSQTARAAPVRLLEDELGVTTAVRIGGTDPFTLSRDTGKSWGRFILELVLLLLALVAIGRIWWRYIRKPSLYGTLVLAGGVEGGPEVKLKGKRKVIDATDFGRVGSTRVKLYTRRGKPQTIFVDRVGAGGELDRRVRTWVPVKSGSSLSVAPHRLDGEGGTRFHWRRAEEEA